MPVHVVDLADCAEPLIAVDQLDALVLSGGSDVNPARYGQPEVMDLCRDIDDVRDDLETSVFEAAERRHLPILGICRGMQMINVLKGGTLIPDLPVEVPGGESHQKIDGHDQTHRVTVVPGSVLFKAVGELEGMVNTAHHQGVGRVAEGFVVSARSDDGVIEAIEPLDPSGRHYVIAVQWHPERMDDPESPFSRKLLEQFLFEGASRRILRV